MKISKEVVNNIAEKRLKGDLMMDANDIVYEMDIDGNGFAAHVGSGTFCWTMIRDPELAQVALEISKLDGMADNRLRRLRVESGEEEL